MSARLSIKASYFLSDCSDAGIGNLRVLPGSHLDAGATGDPVPILARPGDAILFDRRLLHGASPNWSDRTRKIATYGYGYRWIQRNDNVDLTPILDRTTDPIRRQLLGDGTNRSRYGDPMDAPLLSWLREHAPGAL